MKTKFFTLLLSVAFLSAGAFAHGGSNRHIASWGASTVYLAQH